MYSVRSATFYEMAIRRAAYFSMCCEYLRARVVDSDLPIKLENLAKNQKPKNDVNATFKVVREL